MNYSFIKDRNLFVDSFIVKQSLPIHWFKRLSNTFSICFFVVPHCRSCGGGYLMRRLSLQCVIWWWHLVFKVECVPQLPTKLGWQVKIKSIHELELDSLCVGSDISWSKLCNDVSASKCVPSVVVLSSFHQVEDLALTSSKIIVNKESDEAVLLKSSSKSDRKLSNSMLSWLGRRPVDNTNISFTTLQENFTNNTLTEFLP